jgi:hypothetical protein
VALDSDQKKDVHQDVNHDVLHEDIENLAKDHEDIVNPENIVNQRNHENPVNQGNTGNHENPTNL